MDYAKDTHTKLSEWIRGTMHRSATQKTVALSSCAAELNAVVLCVQDMMYQKNALESVGLKVELPMILEMDNKGAVDLINSWYGASQCGAQSNAINLFLRLFFVPIFTYDGLVTLREQPQHITNCRKHSNHGGGAACPSRDEDSINPLDLSRGQSEGGVGRGNRSKKSRSNIYIKVVIGWLPKFV